MLTNPTILYLIILIINFIISDTKSPQNHILQEHIDKVRTSIENYCNENYDHVYMLDCEDVRSRDWVIERYLIDNELDEERTVTKIVENLKFYKKEGLQELTDEYFPAEFYATGYVVRQAKSRIGEAVYGFCQRCYKPLGKISENMYRLGRKYLLYTMYKNRMELDYNSRINFISLANIGFENLDIKYLTNIIDNVNTKQPNMPGVLFALDLPFLVQAAFALLINMLNPSAKRNVHFISVYELDKWVSLSEIPTYVGGRLKNWHRIPMGVRSGKCLPHLSHISIQEWNRFVSQNIECIEEGMKDSGLKSIGEFLGYCDAEIVNPVKLSKNKKNNQLKEKNKRILHYRFLRDYY